MYSYVPIFVPPLVFSITLFAIFYRELLSPLLIAGICALPVSALLFCTVAGLFVNVRMPRLSWKSDTEVVKQSGAVLVMMLICFALILLTGLSMLLIRSDWVPIAASGVLIGLTAGVYRYLMDRAEQIRRNL